MSDISDLHGIFPVSLRWNAECGILGFSTFDEESGERALKEIELGPSATFAMDLLTRERGYGLVKVGVYSMILSPVGSPPPPWPGDGEEYKAALGCWLWCPAIGEVRLESNAALLVRTVSELWDRCRYASQVTEGHQPVIRFVDRRPVRVASVDKTFFTPVIEIIGAVERSKVPGWATREPTVLPPAAMPILSAPTSESVTPANPVPKKPGKARPGVRKRGDVLAELLDDDLPDHLK